MNKSEELSGDKLIGLVKDFTVPGVQFLPGGINELAKLLDFAKKEKNN
jgi:hypothetical protein